MGTCANPGCDQPGTNKCSGCKTTPYCGPICQKDHWADHKESCDGRLLKMGKDHLDKAMGFYRDKNWSKALRYSDLAATKLKQLKDRPVEEISNALEFKCYALGFMGQDREQLECAKGWYCLWNTKPTDPGAIDAAFFLIQSCLTNKEYVDAHLYASTLYEIINHKHDNKIPDDQRQPYIVDGAYYLARATLRFAQTGGIPPEEKQKPGQETIELARKALERLPLKSLKIPQIFSQSLRNRLKLSQLPTHLCTHFCAALRPTSLQNPSPFLPTVSDPHCIRPTPLPFTQSFLSYPLSYLTASYGMASA